jgi:beta-lactamase superfamily II metal-dependent hydrolase
MLKLHAVQAGHGDCLILEFGTPQNKKFILIDGAPPEHYHDVEKAIKQIIGVGNKVEKVVLSHVDMDHVGGLLELFSVLRMQRESGEAELIQIKDLWINEFSSVFGSELETQMMQMMQAASDTVSAMAEGSLVFNGVKEGHKLQADAMVLQIPINNNIAERFISVEHIADPISIANITITIVGPTKPNLDELQHKWEEWLEANREAIENGDFATAAMADESIPNLSSIIMLVEGDEKSMLLTGDCRGDHLIQGLEQRGMLDADGKFHVDIYKGQHHGSDRNTTKKFFKTVTADTYVFSADGKNGNPDFNTLKWLIEAAQEDGREITIFLTNPTDSTKKIMQQFPPASSGYTMRFMPKTHFFITVE